MAEVQDVVVVGGGPVGVTALALLGRAGLRAVGVDREPTAWPAPRAVHFDGETMRLLQYIGVADEVVDRCRPMVDVRMENEEGEILSSAVAGQMGPQAWPDDVMFHQPEIEAALRAAVDRLPGVSLRSGVTLTHLEQDTEGVRVRVDTPRGTEEIRARWVIAADGATSTVRRLLGVQNEQIGSDDPWLVVDGHLDEGLGREGDMVFLGHWSRPALWVRLPGSRVRMEFKIMPGDDREELATPAVIERLSRGALPVNGFTPDRIAVYTFRGRVAERWRVGNTFLAGDAAHQAPPLFGQGLCAGMRDVANLVWKMALVHRGAAGAELLDTYESERRPHARGWVERAVTMARLLQTTDPQTAAGRDDFIRKNPEAAAESTPIALGPGLHAGPQNPRAGLLSVQPMFEDGTRLDDTVGGRFLVATRREILEALAPATRQALESDDETLVLTDEELIGALLGPGPSALVVRPDRYVLGGAETAAELQELLRRLPFLQTRSTSTPQPA